MSDSITFNDWLKALPVQTDPSSSLVMLTDSQGNSSKTDFMRLKCQMLFGVSDIGPCYSRIQETPYESVKSWLDSSSPTWWSEWMENTPAGKVVTMTQVLKGTDKKVRQYYLTVDSLSAVQPNGFRYRMLRPLMMEIDGMPPYFAPQAVAFSAAVNGGGGKTLCFNRLRFDRASGGRRAA